MAPDTDTQRDDLEEIARSNALPAGFLGTGRPVDPSRSTSDPGANLTRTG